MKSLPAPPKNASPVTIDVEAIEPSTPAPPSTIRPGTTDSFLADAGVHRDAQAGGLVIPHRHLDGSPVIDGVKIYARVRLDHPKGDMKYFQAAGTKVHAYLPPGLIDFPTGSDLHIIEGEFKSLALTEAGFAAVGLGGFYGFALAGGEQLAGELEEALKHLRPKRFFYVLDTDAVLNFQASLAAVRLASLLEREILFVVLPFDGPGKGLDDCKEALGVNFNPWWEEMIMAAVPVTARTKAGDLACQLLQREVKAIARARSEDGMAIDRRAAKLAAALQSDPVAQGRVLELAIDAIGINSRVLAKAVKAEIEAIRRDAPADASIELQSPDTQPWPEKVPGAELLDRLAGEFSRFVVLPKHGPEILALWTVHSYSWELVEYSPIIAITSPVPSCGKGRVLDVLEKLVRNPFRTGNLSEAVTFRATEQGSTMLIDELDTIAEEKRDAIANILKHGFHKSGKVHRVEGDGEKTLVEFSSYGPKAVACIKLTTLDRATISRCINIRMRKKRREEKVDRLRKYDATELKRKCLRWVEDNAAKIEKAEVNMPDQLEDRQQDIWEPLFILANLAGGGWPAKVEAAALDLCLGVTEEVDDVGVNLLRFIREHFEESGSDRVSSQGLCDWLNNNPAGSFKGWRDGKGISQKSLSNVLGPFDIFPDSVRIGDATPKGYRIEQFEEAFSTYISSPPPKPGIGSATPQQPASTLGQMHFSASATEPGVADHKNTVLPNNDGPCCGVADENPDNPDWNIKEREEPI